MRKDNLLAKKIKKKFLSINNSLEGYFNNLTLFLKNIKKKKLGTNGKVILGLGVSIILLLSYFLIPTFNDKKLIESEIKNHILKKYNINLNFNEELYYALIPLPHYSSRNASIIKDEKEIAKIKNVKILISPKKFFSFKKIFIRDIIFIEADFNLRLKDLLFFQNLLRIEPNENKVVIKNSNIFYQNKNEEILFINKINKSKFFYDSKIYKTFFHQKTKFLIFLLNF